MSMAPEGRGREEVYGDWLDSRLSGAGQIVSIAMSRFGKAAVRRRSTRDDGSRRLGTIISLPDVTFTGLIRVVESDGFANLIANGIGRHKAFGFGAMLLRPCVS